MQEQRWRLGDLLPLLGENQQPFQVVARKIASSGWPHLTSQSKPVSERPRILGLIGFRVWGLGVQL